MQLLLPVHVLTYGFVFGSSVFHSLIASPRAFETLPRREFGAFQAVTLPIQFATQTLAPLVIGLSAPYTVSTLGLGLLAATSIGGALNILYLTPKCAQLKTERWALIDAKYGGDEALAKASGDLAVIDKQFGKFHMLSMVSNLASIIAITGYGFVLGSKLKPV